ncbi:hypothetical protein [Streptomyces sp. cg40]|uniref:hypothetical protein n=1 Tax=Streptomyces sp. cg40 TaxID=3419764 RepID=UPI003D04C455
MHRTLEVNQRAVDLGQSFFGPLIGSSVALLQGYDERELAAIRGFLAGGREAAAEG